MPDIVKILLVLFGALALLVWFSERNPVKISPERAGTLRKVFMVLMGLMLIGWVIRYFMGG